MEKAKFMMNCGFGMGPGIDMSSSSSIWEGVWRLEHYAKKFPPKVTLVWNMCVTVYFYIVNIVQRYSSAGNLMLRIAVLVIHCRNFKNVFRSWRRLLPYWCDLHSLHNCSKCSNYDPMRNVCIVLLQYRLWLFWSSDTSFVVASFLTDGRWRFLVKRFVRDEYRFGLCKPRIIVTYVVKNWAYVLCFADICCVLFRPSVIKIISRQLIW